MGGRAWPLSCRRGKAPSPQPIHPPCARAGSVALARAQTQAPLACPMPPCRHTTRSCPPPPLGPGGVALRPGMIYGARAVGSGQLHLEWVGAPLKAVSCRAVLVARGSLGPPFGAACGRSAWRTQPACAGRVACRAVHAAPAALREAALGPPPSPCRVTRSGASPQPAPPPGAQCAAHPHALQHPSYRGRLCAARQVRARMRAGRTLCKLGDRGHVGTAGVSAPAERSLHAITWQFSASQACQPPPLGWLSRKQTLWHGLEWPGREPCVPAASPPPPPAFPPDPLVQRGHGGARCCERCARPCRATWHHERVGHPEVWLRASWLWSGVLAE